MSAQSITFWKDLKFVLLLVYMFFSPCIFAGGSKNQTDCEGIALRWRSPSRERSSRSGDGKSQKRKPRRAGETGAPQALGLPALRTYDGLDLFTGDDVAADPLARWARQVGVRYEVLVFAPLERLRANHRFADVARDCLVAMSAETLIV